MPSRWSRPVLLVARSDAAQFRTFSFYKDFTWVSEGRFTSAERDRVVAAAVSADLRSGS